MPRTKYLVKPIKTYTPNQNKAELAIRENKKSTRRLHDQKNIPLILYDYTNQYNALIRSHTALNISTLYNRVLEAIMTGSTPDISHLIHFSY